MRTTWWQVEIQRVLLAAAITAVGLAIQLPRAELRIEGGVIGATGLFFFLLFWWVLAALRIHEPRPEPLGQPITSPALGWLGQSVLLLLYCGAAVAIGYVVAAVLAG